MNRRKFLSQAFAALGAATVVVTKLPSILSNKPPIAQDMAQWPGEDPMRAAHQQALTKWLSDKVDDAAFQMMTRRKV